MKDRDGTRGQELRLMGRGLKSNRIIIIYPKSPVWSVWNSVLHPECRTRDSVCGSAGPWDMHVPGSVCVFRLPCVIAALLCLCRGSVDTERDGRISKPPTVTLTMPL